MGEVPDARPSLLVRLCDPKDDLAWTEFTAIYSPLIYRLACRKGFQEAGAEDLVQARPSARSLPPWSAANPIHVKGPFATGCSESRGT
jgi:hypothetical protein